jgi:predicted anti-sigma-YlaC factor YlaD
MNCVNVRRAVRRESTTGRPSAEAIREHLQGCADCRGALSPELLIGELIRNSAAPRNESEITPSPFFMTRLRARLEAEREERNLSPWEAAVMATRGWLLAFVAIVAVLCTISIWYLRAHDMLLSPNGDLNAEVMALPPGSENILIANGESLSHDAVLSTLFAEENNNGRK